MRDSRLPDLTSDISGRLAVGIKNYQGAFNGHHHVYSPLADAFKDPHDSRPDVWSYFLP